MSELFYRATVSVPFLHKCLHISAKVLHLIEGNLFLNSAGLVGLGCKALLKSRGLGVIKAARSTYVRTTLQLISLSQMHSALVFAWPFEVMS